MKAEVISIGTELLLGDITDSHAQELAKTLAEFGFVHHRRATVGDNLERCSQAISESLSRSDVVFTIGGLGPTEDDITRDAIGQALSEPLIENPEVKNLIFETMQKRNREVLPSHLRMAMMPACCMAIPNDVGVAPGLLCHKNEKWVIALPGPREEFFTVLNCLRENWFVKQATGAIVSKTARIINIPESLIERKIGDLIHGTNPTVAPYAKDAEVHLRITARAGKHELAMSLIQPVIEKLYERFQDYVYTLEDKPLEEVVLELLRLKGKSLATAESCTGGMLGERLTTIPGSSDVYLGGFITYVNKMKQEFVYVSGDDLEKYGAVSEQVARQMAEGVVKATGADYGVGITGIAGPGGATADKPVGLVYVGLSGSGGTRVLKNHYLGNRQLIRFRSTQTALIMLYEDLKGIQLETTITHE